MKRHIRSCLSAGLFTALAIAVLVMPAMTGHSPQTPPWAAAEPGQDALSGVMAADMAAVGVRNTGVSAVAPDRRPACLGVPVRVADPGVADPGVPDPRGTDPGVSDPRVAAPGGTDPDREPARTVLIFSDCQEVRSPAADIRPV